MQPHRGRFLGVELDGEDIACLHGRGKSHAVLGRPDDHIAVARHEPVAVHEVERGGLGNAVEQRRVTRVLHRVPADVRDLDACSELIARARHEPQSLPLAILEADVGEQLHAEADAEKRRAEADLVAQHVFDAALAQVRRGVAKRADARQHDSIGGFDLGGVVGDDDVFDSGVLEALLHAAQVAHLVVDDGDVRAHNAPFVDGTPLTRASSATAAASARATALNAASMMWCAFSPASERT